MPIGAGPAHEHQPHIAWYRDHADGRLIVVDRGSHAIYEVTLDGEIALLAGGEGRGVDDGPALSAAFSLPNSIAISPDGTKLHINQVTHTVGTTVNNPIAVPAIDLGQGD